ncbi:MAG: FG-GAP-like repeat-containing protein [Cyclobacteriaceae bacterium]
MSFRLIFILLIVTSTSVRSQSVLKFTDVSSTAGIELSKELTESLAWGDYDNDGDEDLYLTLNGKNRLFRNGGSDKFTDVTDLAGVGLDLFNVGTAFGDIDNDGDLDLYVVTFQEGFDALYINNNDGTFTDIAEQAGITNTESSRGMAFVDYDHDGLLDIYVNAIGDDILYHNLGDNKFEDIAESKGIVDAEGLGVGIVASDLNDDGSIDIYNGNRGFAMSNLYINKGDGTFEDLASDNGIRSFGLGMGVISFDYDNDLDMDLYWTTWPEDTPTPTENHLYRNNGNAVFSEVAEDLGVEDTWGWGISANSGDIDNDGWEDFFVTNGFSDTTTANVMFRNIDGSAFENVNNALGDMLFDGRGVAFADYDNDGDLDICITADKPFSNLLLRNDSDVGNWLTLKLEGVYSNKSGIGARIEITAGELKMVKEVSGGAGRGSFNSLPVEFGLADIEIINAVDIRWPNGTIQRLQNVTINQQIEVTENHFPTFKTSFEDKTLLENEQFTLPLDLENLFEDLDGDKVELAVDFQFPDSESNWLELDSGTGIISGIPGAEDIGATIVTLKITDSSGQYETTSFGIEVEAAVTSLAESNFDSIKLYPNPSSGILNVQIFDTDLIGNQYSIRNFLGQKIATGRLSFQNRLDLTTRPNGFYVLQILTKDQLIVKKFALVNN